jgi:hypothetical protein
MIIALGYPLQMTIALCRSCGEEKSITARGMCSACYQRAQRSGALEDYSRVKPTFESALEWAKENETDEGCWPWPSVGPTGYPLKAKGYARAYTAVYVDEYGPVPPGLTLDHTCHSVQVLAGLCLGGDECVHRRCVRPDHLEPITMAEQSARSANVVIARASLKCPRGHLWTEENTGWRRQQDHTRPMVRFCRECHVENQHAYLLRRADSLLSLEFC